MGEVYKWDEFEDLFFLKEKLFDYYKYHGLKKAFFHKLLKCYEDYSDVYTLAYKALKTTDQAIVQNRNKINLYYNIDNDPVRTAHEAAYYSKWYWRLIYSIKRTIQNNKNLKPQLEKLEEEIVIDKKIKNLYIPVRWAELLTKNKKNIK
ncbi:hypothetical protein ES705_31705 [subsurface metagenome]